MEGKDETNKKKSPAVIQIPSYQEVVESSLNPKSQQSLFKPSPSFSQAFSFLKQSDFYTPPPAAPSVSDLTPDAAASRQVSQSEIPSSSATSFSRPAATGINPSSSTSQSVQSGNAILVSHRQKGNPLLKHIRNVRWNFADIVSDYVLGKNSCALYISLRYHLLHPDYLYYRIRELQKNFKLRVVLCHVDVEDVIKPLLEVTRTALLHDCTLLCGWSLEECGRYLETIKVYENKPADIIQGQMDTDYLSRLKYALTTVRHVNKTDVVTLGSTFGSLAHIMDASMEDLARCPGIGERKVKRLYDTFHEPFKRVVPSQSTTLKAPLQNKANEPSSVNKITEMENKLEETSKRRKQEPESSLKSALSDAFAKYNNKLAKRDNKFKREDEDTSVSIPAEVETRHSE